MVSIIEPVPGATKTDSFGYRGAVAGLPAGLHNGQDYACAMGTPVRAVMDGVIYREYEAGGFGNYAYQHEANVETFLCHLDRFAVASGTRVQAGDIIGYAGATGAATGVHVHLSVRINGVYVDPVPLISKTSAGNTAAHETEENEMKAIYYKTGKNYVVGLFNSASGFFSQYTTTDPEYNNSVAKGLGTGSFVAVSESHFNAIKRDCEAVRQ